MGFGPGGSERSERGSHGGRVGACEFVCVATCKATKVEREYRDRGRKRKIEAKKTKTFPSVSLSLGRYIYIQL